MQLIFYCCLKVRPEIHDEVIKLLVDTDPETADDLLKAMSNDMGWVTLTFHTQNLSSPCNIMFWNSKLRIFL